MEPVYLDLHIHTSKDPDQLNAEYDIATLQKKVQECAMGSPCLISLTDHNTINKVAYLNAASLFPHMLIGAELHVRNYRDEPPYHCHIFFRSSVDAVTIDALNMVLDALYPKKTVCASDQIPSIEEIAKHFDAYEFVLLPHGGQSHSTFDKSIPKGVQFDTTIERSIYYNHFDGFTARSNSGLEDTQDYLRRLGISDFVNLITSTDNYNPKKYPESKATQAEPFVTTWMLASPTFNGLRLSLSESDRLVYGTRPDTWAEFIRHVSLSNDYLDIDAALTPGLNVVIGGSSSGKTLFVDSVYRRLRGDFSDSNYLAYGVDQILVDSPTGQVPHFLEQNYIVKVCDQKDHDNTIDSIALLRRLFPGDKDERTAIDTGLTQLSESLSQMVEAAEKIEAIEEELKTIPVLSRLVVTTLIKRNPLKYLKPTDSNVETFEYSEATYLQHKKSLDVIESFLETNPFVDHDKALVEGLKAELDVARSTARFESNVRQVIIEHADTIHQLQTRENRETKTKSYQFDTLLRAIRNYLRYTRVFYASRDRIAKFSITCSTRVVESMGHRLFIENAFELSPAKFVEILNQTLLSGHQIRNFEEITPAALSSVGFRKRAPKVTNYADLHREVLNRFQAMNRKKYRITTCEGKDFDQLSAGWKTSVILDLVLGCATDTAPLIIDQPEDNLATTYINTGLLKAIKQCKAARQIILVSHNATIPMLGDAQNVIVCRTEDKFMTIRSSPLEGEIEDLDVVDVIAATTDGGKSSIKKRVKKYNLKRFRGENETRV
ncbi:PHP domain-containing protein [Syntrophotalea acetylenica]|uniref:ATPase n=1 Tax=Syntrophotalea acetylenica TaxID=29542 RepID=A0A1L3GDE5_SYNAC|nr:ATPase [Syntrophotalea acetylenica]APG23972.1 ATPase [Syntrophotalea acetylenica]APG44554.1 ATPase [Syntrophotalea acetylenica]